MCINVLLRVLIGSCVSMLFSNSVAGLFLIYSLWLNSYIVYEDMM